MAPHQLRAIIGGDLKGGVKLNTGKNTKLQFLHHLFSQVNRTGKGGKIECHVGNAPKKIASFKMSHHFLRIFLIFIK